MLTELLGMRGVIEGDGDGFVMDADIAVNSVKEVLGEMPGLPVRERGAESLSELMSGGLSEKCHGHVAVADVEILSACAIPAQGLLCVKELLDVPAFWELDGEGFEFLSL